jgi:hypothetical protein
MGRPPRFLSLLAGGLTIGSGCSLASFSLDSRGRKGAVLGDQVLAAVVLDRILHHLTTVNIRGES